jgi:hypothetical protein
MNVPIDERYRDRPAGSLLRMAIRLSVFGLSETHEPAQTSALRQKRPSSPSRIGPAVRCKRFVDLVDAVLHYCIRPLVGAWLRATMDISAHAT